MLAQLMHHGARGNGLGGGIVTALLLLVVPAMILALVVYGVVTLWHNRPPAAPVAAPAMPPPRAQHILDERFARGEIDADEYIRLSAVLRANRDGSPPAPFATPTSTTPPGDDPPPGDPAAQ